MVVVVRAGEGVGGGFELEATFLEGLDDLCFDAIRDENVVGEVG